MAMATPITKFACRVVHASEIPRVIAHAFRVAVDGGPGKGFPVLASCSPIDLSDTGPVMLDVPIELMMSPVNQEHISWGAIADSPTYPPGPNEDAIEALAQLWKSAKRPIIIAEVIRHGKTKVRIGKPPAAPFCSRWWRGPSRDLIRFHHSLLPA